MNEVRSTDLPSYQRWSDQFLSPVPPSGYLLYETSLISAMVVSELIFPQLIEVRGCVVRAEKYHEQVFNQWCDTFHGDLEQIERITNFQPMRDYFRTEDEIEERALVTLAERVALGWRTIAPIRFPDRRFSVEVNDESEDEGPTVVLFSQR
jgi:hypothetical protein